LHQIISGRLAPGKGHANAPQIAKLWQEQSPKLHGMIFTCHRHVAPGKDD
jgi:hypothetical protein